MYYHVRRALQRLQVPLLHKSGFNAADNHYSNKEFLKICKDSGGVHHDPMRYRDENFYWIYQRGIGWPDDYIGPDSMTHFRVLPMWDCLGFQRVLELTRI